MNAAATADRGEVVMLVMAFPPKAIGGAEMQCLKLSRRLVARGVPVRVLTEGGVGLPRIAQMDGIVVHRLFCFPGALILRSLDSLARLRRRRGGSAEPRPDGLPYDPADSGIQFRNSGREAVRYLLFFLNALPVVWRERKSIGVLHVHIVPWISTVGSVLGGLFHLPVVVKESTVTGVATVRGLPFGRLMLKITRARSVFIAMSGAIRRALLAEGISESRIEMIPNGVEAQSRSTVARTPSTCLVVGNLTQGAAKGFDALFRSWVEVLRAVPHAELLVAGTGDPVMFDRFLELQGIARSVKFLGSVSDLQELYRSVAVVALPSRREGMSNALLEAMAAEAPIVATRVSGSEDLIQPGITGVLVEVDDIAGMTSGILGFFNDAGFARRCGERARATVLAQCGMDLVVDRHMALYDRLVRARTQTPTGAGGGRS